MAKKCAIIVPIYKKHSKLLEYESKLINHLLKIFCSREIILVLPEKLKGLFYSNNYDCTYFQDHYFKNKFSYSKLLCSSFFYNAFAEFEYIQIVQLDCWIFQDRLNEFMDMEFDYIGAPWMKNGFEGKPEPELWKVGNGGFSLRKVSSFLSVINQIESTKKGTSPVFTDFSWGLIGALKQMGIRNNLSHYIKSPPGEDIFWSIYVPLVFGKDEFNVADTKTAAHYSFETLPRYLYESVTKGTLPMGCHNWSRNDPDFWQSHISLQNV